MRSCDVAVLGLGLMGSAALNALLNANVDALGFDPLGPGAIRGSSHGSCRVFRRFNFESENYTDLSDAACRLEAP
jgi:sarcosine oxidase